MKFENYHQRMSWLCLPMLTINGLASNIQDTLSCENMGESFGGCRIIIERSGGFRIVIDPSGN